MRAEYLQAIGEEVTSVLTGRMLGRVFALSRDSFAVDFHPHAGQYLFVSTEARHSRAHLIRRRLRDIERSSVNPAPLHRFVREHMANRALVGVKVNTEALHLTLEFEDQRSLVACVGRTKRNALILSPDYIIEAALLQHGEIAYRVGDTFVPSEDTPSDIQCDFAIGGESLSDVLDRHFRELAEAEQFRKLAAASRKKIVTEITKRRRLLDNLSDDSRKHGDSDVWKKYGDLLLASPHNARREGNRVFVADLFSEGGPEIAIEVDKDASITDAAEGYFRRYAKARNAAEAIAARTLQIQSEIAKLQGRSEEIEAAIRERQIDMLERYVSPPPAFKATPEKKGAPAVKGVRRFISSDGFEVLVGKKAEDNDHLSFRIAKSHDLWLHAADYPGSHVVIRNPNKREVPQRTLIEAAELAAFYSDARQQAKAAVNYTLRKHINKPRRGAPGLVSLSSHKTMMVEPKVGIKLV